MVAYKMQVMVTLLPLQAERATYDYKIMLHWIYDHCSETPRQTTLPLQEVRVHL